MQRIVRALLAALIVTLLTPAAFAQVPPAQVAFDNQMALTARHPEIWNSADFKRWLNNRGVGPWYETPVNDGTQTVVIQDPPGENVFAALITLSGQLQRTAAFNLTQTKQTRESARGAAQTGGIAPVNIIALRPVVEFLNEGKSRLLWEIEVDRGTKIETYRWSGGPVERNRSRSIDDKGAARNEPVKPGIADDMANNELHHLPAFGIEAQAWIAGATTVQDKAKRIFDKVDQTYRYDSTIQHISEFTWADFLTRDRNGRRGICDEYAVVEISYLRSVNIPARLKFLIWYDGAKWVGHAALEYSDNGTWRHMDALWRAFNNPARYRQSGATNVTVMDADYPLDSRYNGSAWGVPDVPGDAKLYPYGDFIISPAYPGNARPGYSY